MTLLFPEDKLFLYFSVTSFLFHPYGTLYRVLGGVVVVICDKFHLKKSSGEARKKSSPEFQTRSRFAAWR